MITVNAICDDRMWLIKPKEINSKWGYICCEACLSIATARDSWMEVYA